MKIEDYIQASIDHPERCEDAIMSYFKEGKAAVFAVIDGMGGHQRQLEDGSILTGQDAAEIVRQTLIEDLQHLPADVSAALGGEAEIRIKSALERAHQKIFQTLNLENQQALNQRVGAVATIVVVCENGSRLLTVQVGDTRAYVFSEDELIQLCYDEDNVEYLVKLGLINAEDGAKISSILNSYDGVNQPKLEGTITISGTPYELYIAWRWFLVGNSVLNIPASNIVINSLGINEGSPVFQMSRLETSPNDILVLCSDGAYKNLTDSEITDILLLRDDLANKIGTMAYERSQTTDNRRSTHDDISVIVVNLS